MRLTASGRSMVDRVDHRTRYPKAQDPTERGDIFRGRGNRGFVVCGRSPRVCRLLVAGKETPCITADAVPVISEFEDLSFVEEKPSLRLSFLQGT